SEIELVRSHLAPGGSIRELSQAGVSWDLFYVETGTITAHRISGDRPAVNLGSGFGPAAVGASPAAGGDVTIAAGRAARPPRRATPAGCRMGRRSSCATPAPRRRR